MDTPRNLTPERGPSVWDKPARPSPYGPIVALAAFAVAAGVAWRYRSFGKALITKGAGLGGMVVGFAMSPAGHQFANILMERWSASRRRADVVVDHALEDTFPASDPPALTYHG